MTVYSAVLFIHVVSAIAMFIALAAEGMILLRVRSAQGVKEVRFFIGVFQRLRTIAIPAFLGVLVGGLYLGSQYGTGTYWIPLALAATLLIMVIGGLVTGRRISRLREALSSDETDISIEAMLAKTKDNALLISCGVRMGLGLGITFLMTVKPELVFSAVALGVSCVIGLFIARAMRRMGDQTKKRCEPWGGAVHPAAQKS